MNRISFVLIALFAASACGDDDGGAATDARRIDASAPPDARGNCVAGATYAAPAMADQAAFGGDVTALDMGFLAEPNYAWEAILANETPQVALMRMYFWEGFGALSGGLEATTYNITGAELSYQECGLCTIIYTDLTIDGSGVITAADEYYFQTGGSMTFTSVPSGNDRPAIADGGFVSDARPTPGDGGWGALVGMTNNLTFGEIDASTANLIQGGCQTALDNTAINDPSVERSSGGRRIKPHQLPSIIGKTFRDRDGRPISSR